MEQINNQISVGVVTDLIDLKIGDTTHNLSGIETDKFVGELGKLIKEQLPKKCPECNEQCFVCSFAVICPRCNSDCHECNGCPAKNRIANEKEQYDKAKAAARSEHRIIQLDTNSSVAIEISKESKVSIHFGGLTEHLTKEAKNKLLEALKYVEGEEA